MANAFSVTIVAATAMMTALGVSVDAGTAAVIEIRDGSVPADADATETGTLLASLTCAATAWTGVTTSGVNARATFAAITSDSSADATGTASYWRLKTQTGGTVIMQGTVGTASADLILNTVAITSGSTVAITAATIDLPKE